MIGVLVEESGTTANIRSTVIQDTRSDDDGLFGYGVSVWQGSSLVLEDGEVSRNTVVGVRTQSAGTSVALHGTVIRDTQRHTKTA